MIATQIAIGDPDEDARARAVDVAGNIKNVVFSTLSEPPIRFIIPATRCFMSLFSHSF